MGAEIPRTLASANTYQKVSWLTVTGAVPVLISARPLAIDNVPRVTRKEGIKNLATSIPLLSPTNAPTVIPTIAPRNQFCVTEFINKAADTPERARTEPTDRSISPVIITSATPAAMIVTRAVWLKMFKRLPEERNTGLPSEKPTISSKKARYRNRGWSVSFSLWMRPRVFPPADLTGMLDIRRFPSIRFQNLMKIFFILNLAAFHPGANRSVFKEDKSRAKLQKFIVIRRAHKHRGALIR